MSNERGLDTKAFQVIPAINLLDLNYHITDGHGSYWSKTCPSCGQDKMEVVRPGKAQCGACG